MDVSLTDREAEFMQILWRQGPSTVAEVRGHLADQPAYTTVLTILRNLEAKAYVGHIEEGRAHRYQALIDSDLARASALRALAHKLFDGSAELLLTHLVSDKRLSSTQLRRIRRLLDAKPKRESGS
ncbi:MAG TPA: BlaI/MecI/CopY family transcriptional regulator [Steroidobacteraceae bacterium]|jgi:BlaI family penicillinase repressor|nr:BlaI/MecI/CopY family transcriptional regulator [Steroidobacteraceae bacterium]